MLEIPESHTLAKQLAQTVTGRTLTRVEAAQSPHGFAFYSGDPAGYPLLLEGCTITGAVPRAGQVELQMGRMRMLFGDGTNLRYLAPGEPPPKKHQLLLALDDGSHLVCTVQMYGSMWAFKEGENQNPYYLVTLEKPSPLTDGFTPEHFQGIWEEAPPNLTAKGLLATEQRIPGVGNGVLQDILFRAGVHPQSKVSALDPRQRDTLYHTLRQTLEEMTRQGGRDTEKDLFGRPGGYKTILSAKTKDSPCPHCGGPILRKAYMGGNVYLCPSCQPLQK